MNDLGDKNPFDDDPRVAVAILAYFEAHESGTPLDDATWPLQLPEELRPTLCAFLADRAVVANAATPAETAHEAIIPAEKLPSP